MHVCIHSARSKNYEGKTP
ncbi:hypothetical protein GQ600_23994 [Phytophthora cactorum]|nr:hypothetical protein GQ600_23994 [Phytophthora cactorum]